MVAQSVCSYVRGRGVFGRDAGHQVPARQLRGPLARLQVVEAQADQALRPSGRAAGRAAARCRRRASSRPVSRAPCSSSSAASASASASRGGAVGRQRAGQADGLPAHRQRLVRRRLSGFVDCALPAAGLLAGVEHQQQRGQHRIRAAAPGRGRPAAPGFTGQAAAGARQALCQRGVGAEQAVGDGRQLQPAQRTQASATCVAAGRRGWQAANSSASSSSSSSPAGGRRGLDGQRGGGAARRRRAASSRPARRSWSMAWWCATRYSQPAGLAGRPSTAASAPAHAGWRPAPRPRPGPGEPGPGRARCATRRRRWPSAGRRAHPTTTSIRRISIHCGRSGAGRSAPAQWPRRRTRR
jgi:hypothetical protein